MEVAAFLLPATLALAAAIAMRRALAENIAAVGKAWQWVVPAGGVTELRRVIETRLRPSLRGGDELRVEAPAASGAVQSFDMEGKSTIATPLTTGGAFVLRPQKPLGEYYLQKADTGGISIFGAVPLPVSIGYTVLPGRSLVASNHSFGSGFLASVEARPTSARGASTSDDDVVGKERG